MATKLSCVAFFSRYHQELISIHKSEAKIVDKGQFSFPKMLGHDRVSWRIHPAGLNVWKTGSSLEYGEKFQFFLSKTD